jgi:hypothetical protein
MFKDDEDNLDDIRKLYPHMTDEELREARDNIRIYLAVVIRIAKRLEAEGKTWSSALGEDDFAGLTVNLQ